MVSRRQVLKAALPILAGLTVPNSAVSAVLKPPSFFTDSISPGVIKIAAQYLERNPQEKNLKLLTQRLGFDQLKGNFAAHLTAQNSHDFEVGDVFFVDGWVISRTEARICTLFAHQKKSELINDVF